MFEFRMSARRRGGIGSMQQGLRPLWALALLIGALASPAVMAAQDAAPRHFEARDLFFLQAASDPQISPDGNHVVYVRRSADIMSDRIQFSLWLVDARSGEETPLATEGGASRGARWSPDGTRLAYVSSSEGAGSQIHVRWLASGATVRITGLPDAPSHITWSPDGRQIAYVMRVPGEPLRLGTTPAKPEGAKWAAPLKIYDTVTYQRDGAGPLKPGYSHIFVVPAIGGAPRQLSFGDFNDRGPLSWTRDGKALLFGANRTANWERDPWHMEIHNLDVASGKVKALTNHHGPADEPVVSPDGQLIAYVGFTLEPKAWQNRGLYVMNRDGSGNRVLTREADLDVSSPQWAADGRSLFVLIDHHGTRQIIRVDLNGKITPVLDGLGGADWGIDRPYLDGSFSVAANDEIAWTKGSPDRPPEVAWSRGGKTQVLTRLNENLLGGRVLGPVQKLEVTAPDKRPIDAWLTLPPSYRQGERVPLILEIHGGPYESYGAIFATDNQLFASAGFAVLSVNPRGSTGYGQEFVDLVQYEHPRSEYGDLMAAVDAAVAKGIADPERLFVTGGSGGGILTAWIVGKTHRFKAAATQKPVVNWISDTLTSDLVAWESSLFFGKYPWEDHEAYWSRSPLSLAGNVRTPTLVLVGSEDRRTAVSEAEQFYSALQLLRVPTALVIVPGVGHNDLSSRPSQDAARVAAIIAWFEKYMKGVPATPAKPSQAAGSASKAP